MLALSKYGFTVVPRGGGYVVSWKPPLRNSLELSLTGIGSAYLVWHTGQALTSPGMGWLRVLVTAVLPALLVVIAGGAALRREWLEVNGLALSFVRGLFPFTLRESAPLRSIRELRYCPGAEENEQNAIVVVTDGRPLRFGGDPRPEAAAALVRSLARELDRLGVAPRPKSGAEVRTFAEQVELDAALDEGTPTEVVVKLGAPPGDRIQVVREGTGELTLRVAPTKNKKVLFRRLWLPLMVVFLLMVVLCEVLLTHQTARGSLDFLGVAAALTFAAGWLAVRWCTRPWELAFTRATATLTVRTLFGKKSKSVTVSSPASVKRGRPGVWSKGNVSRLILEGNDGRKLSLAGGLTTEEQDWLLLKCREYLRSTAEPRS